MIYLDEVGDKEIRALKSFILHIFLLFLNSRQETGDIIILVGVNRFVPMYTLAFDSRSTGVHALLLVNGDFGHFFELLFETSWGYGSQKFIILALDLVFLIGLFCKVVSDVKENILSNRIIQALLLHSLDFLVEVDHVWCVFVSEEFESHKMKDGEQEFVTYHGGNVDSKPINDVQSSIVSQLWFSWSNFFVLDKGINQNDVDTVGQDEEEKEVDSEHEISVLEGLLFLNMGSELSFTGGSLGSWSVTPREIVKVAHGVDLHDIGESWQKEHIGDHSNHVSGEVVKEIEWSQDHWEEEYGHHDPAAEDGVGEIWTTNIDEWLLISFLTSNVFPGA